jgi:DNA polymerase I-like protein with 3'-5' exonuclease and polymerase domains
MPMAPPSGSHMTLSALDAESLSLAKSLISKKGMSGSASHATSVATPTTGTAAETKKSILTSTMSSLSLPPWITTPSPDVYLRDDYLTLDFECVANDGRFGSAVDGRNALYLACWDFQGERHYCWGGEYEQRSLVEAIGKASYLVGHNIKYELGWLQRMGVDLSKLLVCDTQVAEYVLLGNLASGDSKRGLRPRSISLDSCRRRRGMAGKDPIIDLWLKNGITVDRMPRPWLKSRCSSDVSSTKKLWLTQRTALAASGRLPVFFTRCLLTPVLADIEAQGMHLDKERVTRAHAETLEQFQTLDRAMSEFTGGINWRSPAQAAGFIYDELQFAELSDRSGKPKRTKTGRRATSAKVLDKLCATTDRQRSFLSLRHDIGKVSAALSKNLNYFKAIVDDPSSGCVFKAELNQTRTATHRLSSTGIPCAAGSVQFQNLPRKFKGLFSPRNPGWVIAEADSAQLEFRVAAFLGNDAQAKRDIADVNWDAHVTSAAAMAGVGYDALYEAYKGGDEGAAEKRQSAKPETFKPLYGGQRGTPAQERWYAEFRRRYPDLNAVQEGWKHAVIGSRLNELITPWGLRFYFPHASVAKSGYVNVTASIYNYPVQSFATADIIPIALVFLWHRIKAAGHEDRIWLVNTVHDSIAAELDPELAPWFEQQCIEAFTMDVYRFLKQVYRIEFDVPLGAGIKIGAHLGEGKEKAIDVYPDGRIVKRK